MKFKVGDKVIAIEHHPEIEVGRVYTIKNFSTKYRHLIYLLELPSSLGLNERRFRKATKLGRILYGRV